MRRAESERLVDDKIGDNGADPGKGDMGIKGESGLKRAEHAEIHQHQRNCHIEHHPDDAAGMTMGKAGKEVRPGDGTGIGVGDIDFELAEDHEGTGQRQHENRVVNHLAKGGEIHLVGVGRRLGRNARADGDGQQKRPQQHLARAEDRPARSGAH